MVTEEAETTTTNDGAANGAAESGKTIATRSVKDSDGDQGGDVEDGTGSEGEGKGDDGEGSDESKAPEQYADFNLPENFTLEGEELEGVKAIFKELDLPQEAAQKLVDWEVARRVKLAEEEAARKDEEIKGWEKSVAEHPVLGGKNMKATEAASARALMAFDYDGSLAELLETTGYGNHPAMVQFLAALGSQISEDSGGTGGEGSGKNPMSTMYPTMFEQET